MKLEIRTKKITK